MELAQDYLAWKLESWIINPKNGSTTSFQPIGENGCKEENCEEITIIQRMKLIYSLPTSHTHTQAMSFGPTQPTYK